MFSKLFSVGLVACQVAACGPKAERPAQAADSLPQAPTPAASDSSAHVPAVPAPSPRAATPAPARPPATPAPKPRPTQVATTPAPAPTPVPTTAEATPAPDPYHPAPRDTLDADTYQGWKQFELNCARCHGEYAVGSSFAPALVVSLKEGGTIPTKEMFITTVCAGRLDKGMPSWCALGLEMNKIEQIYAYVKGRADGKIAAGRPAQRQ